MTEWKMARKKPLCVRFREVEAKQSFSGSTEIISPRKKGETVQTLNGPVLAVAGEDFIICGKEGELYPINKKIFYKTYDVIDEA